MPYIWGEPHHVRSTVKSVLLACLYVGMCIITNFYYRLSLAPTITIQYLSRYLLTFDVHAQGLY